MKIFLTGGTGFLGRRILPLLLDAGHSVIALSRSEAADRTLADAGAVPHRGDMACSISMLPPMDAVVHAAAHFRLSGPRAPYFATNVAGTSALLAASKAAGASAFVHISAAAVIMDDKGSPLREVDESAPVFPDSFSAYIGSKAQAEALVLAANVPGFRTLALRPPGIWGKGDAFSTALPAMLRRRQFGFIQGGNFDWSTCHVDNVAEAVICAIGSQIGGRAYFINDAEPITFRQFVIDVAKALGLDASRAPSMPYGFARGMAGVMEGLWSLAGGRVDPPMSRTLVRFIGREFTTSDAAARRDLGYVGRVMRQDGLRVYC
jgi:nucleoside-diphosphate-sugar epimerase